MARKKNHVPNGPNLFEEQERHRMRRIRRQRALFIPRFLHEAGGNLQLKDAKQDDAYAVALRWADLETNGHLPKYKETSIDTQFLDQLFGEGLGYQVKTTSPDAWQLEHKFTVTGVGIADAALGEFPASRAPTVVVELKGAMTDLDRDRSNGRTAVQQCWDYLNALPGCTWGIVSNFTTIRLYHHEKGILSYEEFTLQELRDRERFNEFYCLFERGGLLRSRYGQQPRASELLRRTVERQKEVGEDLYQSYHWQRLSLIEHLMKKEHKPLDAAIRIAQKLLDRIIFIAFCEDRELLNEDCLKRASEKVAAFSQARNPLWKNFLGLFAEVDRGGKNVGLDQGYNGNLFKPDPEIDNLELEDEPWIRGFKNFGDYDFSEEVNVEVLGHLFERSITELEKLRVGGLFALKANLDGANGKGEAKAAKGKGKRAKNVDPDEESPLSKMPKNAQRKRFGIYYTPPAFTGLIVERTIDVLVKERFAALAKQYQVDPEARKDHDAKRLLAYWSACLEDLKAVTVCDPACGSGAFLIRAYDALDAHYKTVVHGLAGAGMVADEVTKLEEAIPDLILNHNLFGVDLSQEAVEITQLALWIRSARKERKLSDLSRHILCGNSLVSDAAVDAKALDWHKAFPHIFGGDGLGGFSCVIGNPPWERVKFQHREFFAILDKDITAAVNPDAMRRLAHELEDTNPDLYVLYQAAFARADSMLSYSRDCGHFQLTAKGDINLYMLFAEKARTLVAGDGVVGLLVPSGIATDDTTKEFFSVLMDAKRLVSLYDFENKEGHFEDVHRSFKFTALVFGGENRRTEKADFVFFARGVEDTAEHNKQRHIPLSATDMALLNPNTKTCPIFRTRRDAELTKAIYKRIPILIDANRKHGGNPWGISFLTMFHQSGDSADFVEGLILSQEGLKLRANIWEGKHKKYLPLYEAKMVQAFDHRAAGIVIEGGNWLRKAQKAEVSLVQHQNPEFVVQPRWWIQEPIVDPKLPKPRPPALVAFKNVTSPTNSRTMIAAFIPTTAVGHSAPLILPGPAISPRATACFVANLNAYVYDYIARQKVGGVNFSYFILAQIPTLPPDAYADRCPWSKKETLEHWISERVLKLTCTAEDMIPLAQACDFKGSRGDGVHIWKEAERAELRAELDAAYFHLYGVARADAEYMLSTFTNTGLAPEDERGSQQALWQTGSTGERVLAAFDRLGRP
jgi:N-6 DNA Methylase